MNGFALWIGLGATLGLAWVAVRAERSGKFSVQKIHALVDAGLALLGGALLGGRAAYVFINWGYFEFRPVEALQVWLGGLAWPGVIFGGLVGLAFYAWWNGASVAELADHLLPLVLTLSLAAWLANWQIGVAYGQLSSGWWAVPAIDEWGETGMRFPLQALAAVATLGAFWVIDLLRNRLRRPGQAAGLALVFLALILLVVSFLRADPAPIWLYLRLDVWAAIAFLGLALGWCIFVFFPKPRKKLETVDSNHPS